MTIVPALGVSEEIPEGIEYFAFRSTDSWIVCAREYPTKETQTEILRAINSGNPLVILKKAHAPGVDRGFRGGLWSLTGGR